MHLESRRSKSKNILNSDLSRIILFQDHLRANSFLLSLVSMEMIKLGISKFEGFPIVEIKISQKTFVGKLCFLMRYMQVACNAHNDRAKRRIGICILLSTYISRDYRKSVCIRMAQKSNYPFK